MMINAINTDNMIQLPYLKLYPQLVNQFNSRSAALLIDRLEYWFSLKKFASGFYKFLEPCNHYLYHKGDSWHEELSLTRVTFNKLFDLMGMRYKSKTEFKAQSNPFQDKLYACYYDRQKRTMFYIRNHNYAQQFFKSLSLNKIVEKNDSFKRTVLYKNTSEKSIKDGVQERSKNDSHFRSRKDIDIQRNTNISSREKPSPATTADLQIQKVGEEMKAIWLEEVGHCTVSTLSANLAQRMASFLKASLNNCLKVWRAYCRKIASSKFLMGEVSATFKAWLPWVIKQLTFEKIEAGEYTIGDRTITATTGQQTDYQAMAEANIAQQPTEQDQAFHRYLLNQQGPLTYHHWFKDLKITKVDGDNAYIQALSAFLAAQVQSRYESLLKEALKAYAKDIHCFCFIDNDYSVDK